MTKRKKSCKGCACAERNFWDGQWKGQSDSIRCWCCSRQKQQLKREDRYVKSSNAAREPRGGAA